MATLLLSPPFTFPLYITKTPMTMAIAAMTIPKTRPSMVAMIAPAIPPEPDESLCSSENVKRDLVQVLVSLLSDTGTEPNEQEES